MEAMREKLIELLKEADRYEFEEQKKSGTFSVEAGWKLIADHLIANGVTVQEWISVKDRLPDLELVDAKANDLDVYPCLCVVKHQRDRVRRYITKLFYDGENFVDGDMLLWTFETTHWMPLPPPPEGE